MCIGRVKHLILSWKNKLDCIPEQGASLLICFPDKVGKVLLIQRNIAPLYGQWSIPGGARNIGESFKECALREASEELCGGKSIITLLRPYIVFEGETPKLTSFWLYFIPLPRKRCWKVYVLNLKKMASISLFDTNYEVKNLDWFCVDRLPSPIDITTKASILLYMYLWKTIGKIKWHKK